MEASPRDNEETAVDDVQRVGHGGAGSTVGRFEGFTGLDGRSRDLPEDVGAAADGPADGDGAAVGDHDDTGEPPVTGQTPEEPQELRPQRKLRLWQLAPIVGLGTLGSLMFAFPLAFEPGGGTGAVVSMLGLLICACAAGWGVIAARRVGLTWPGLAARGSSERTDWRVVLLYAVVVGTVVALAIWRVARLR